MLRVKNIQAMFREKLENEDFVLDKSGVKVVEILGATYVADEEVIFGKLSELYAKKEVEWYESQSLNVYDMPNAPKIWREICDKNGYINSNYGWVVFSEENGDQYKYCLRELRCNPDTRRAMMIYTRPTMHTDYNKNGMSDFMCTNSVQILIRDNKLVYILNQRSCDAIFGAKNDLYWARYIQNKLVQDLQEDYPGITAGDLIHQCGSIHVYENHFHLIKDN